MKKNLVTSMVLVALLAQTAMATLSYSETWTANQAIPDGSPAGSVFSQTISGQYNGVGDAGINGVSVLLNISGGYNGDLYGYLVFNDGATTQTALLLNRVGQSESSPYGSAGSGFTSITLSDAGSVNIHDYAATAGSPVPTGTYLNDGASLNTTFGGMNANGTWTLFLADLSGGDVSTLVSWGLDVSVVPEPATWALIIFGSLVGIYALARRLRRQPVA